MINKIYTKLITHDDNIQIKTAYGIYKIKNTSQNIMDMINYALFGLIKLEYGEE